MSLDPAPAERKPDTGPLPALPEALLVARSPLSGYWRWAIVVAGVVLAVGALFFFTRPLDPMTDRRPVEVVKGFVAAMEAKDPSGMLLFFEPTVFRREIGHELRTYIEYIEEIRFDNPHYELVDNDGDIAHVRLTATMRYRLNTGEITSGD